MPSDEVQSLAMPGHLHLTPVNAQMRSCNANILYIIGTQFISIRLTRQSLMSQHIRCSRGYRQRVFRTYDEWVVSQNSSYDKVIALALTAVGKTRLRSLRFSKPCSTTLSLGPQFSSHCSSPRPARYCQQTSKSTQAPLIRRSTPAMVVRCTTHSPP